MLKHVSSSCTNVHSESGTTSHTHTHESEDGHIENSRKSLCTRWDGQALTLTADEQDARKIFKEFDLDENLRGITVLVDPGVITPDGEDTPLEGKDVTRFRALAARANYLGQDRCDIQYATKEISRGMAKPTKGSLAKMKRLARYLLEMTEGVLRYESNCTKLDKVLVYVDSD